MAQPIAIVNLSLRTATVSRAGFGTLIFISSHRAFTERVRTYNSLTAVGEDFGTSDPAYIAAQSTFSGTPSPAVMKIGRREANMSLVPINVAATSIYTVTVTVNDGDAVTAAYTASGGDTAEDVVDAFKTAIDADTSVTDHITATKVGAGAEATLTISPVAATDEFTLTELSNISQVGTSNETAADVLQEIRDVDDDFYFVTAEDHTEAFVTGMASTVQATEKMYFVSVQEQDPLSTPYAVGGTSILALLRTSKYTRTAAIWSHDADTQFRECNYVGANAPFAPERNAVVWDVIELDGVPVAQNAQGNALTTNQKANLDSYNTTYVASTLAGNRAIGGKVVGGGWIDNQRTLDNIGARVKENFTVLIANQRGSKVAGNTSGISLARGTLASALQPFVLSNALSDYDISIENATIDTSTRTLSGMTFDANFAGAITRVIIDGNLIDAGV